MTGKTSVTRRSAIKLTAAALGAAATGIPLATGADLTKPLKGRLRQSVCRWCYQGIPLDTLCARAREIGLIGIDLLYENEWDIVKRHGLTCTMAYGIGSIPDGWNQLENHDRLVAEAEAVIPKVAAAGWPNLITFSGSRRGLTDDQGMQNCVTGLKRIAKLAEANRVTVCMELLNSKRDHHDYQCDHTAWGVEVCRRVGSERIKLLYDIYHMQIMEGDVCATIRENISAIAHFHTGGVPGRHEIDDSQELNYGRISQAIVESGFQGVLAHEFLPLKDPVASLRQAAHICDV